MKTDIEIKNAVISSTDLSIERSMLTGFVNVEFGGGSGQGFGGHVLYNDTYRNKEGEYTAGPYAGHFIQRVCEIAGVERWEKLKGSPIRVKSKPWGIIQAIGHFLNDDWFDINEEFEIIRKGLPKNVELPDS